MEYADNENSMQRAVRSALGVPAKDPRQLSPLVLAYIGDTIFDLYVRTGLIEHSDAGVHALHKQASARVCAAAQAKAYFRIAEGLTPEEQEVFRRGRNAHPGTVPKNASISDYRCATGLEALLGYLYLKGEDARLNALVGILLEAEENACGQA